MKNAFSICKRELFSFFVSPVAYAVIAGFVLLSAYFFFSLLLEFVDFVNRFNAAPPYARGNIVPNLNQGVIEYYYGTLLLILVFVVPLITMRVIAEERKRGTFELLLTSPISVGEIVAGKFLGVVGILLVMILAAFSYPLILCIYGNPEVLPVLSGLLGLFLSAVMFASIGMAASSFTENQIVAGISSMVALLLLYVISIPAESVGGSIGAVLSFLSPVFQSQDFFKGVVSVKGLAYFLSLTFFGLFISQRALDAFRWR